MLIELTRRQLRNPDGVKVSSRDLASACNVSRSNVQPAIDALTAGNKITARAGTTKEAATYRVTIFDTIPISRPGVALKQGHHPPAQGWKQNRATLDLFQGQPGPESGPPCTETTALTASDDSIDSSTALPAIFESMLKSKPSDFPPEDVAWLRRWLHGYMKKLGRDERNQPTPDAHPPDDDLLAQLLTIGEPRRLDHLLNTLLNARKTCYSYAWFRAVALHRIHGITWQQQKKATALRLATRAGRPQPPEPEQQTFDTSELLSRAVAGVKKLR